MSRLLRLGFAGALVVGAVACGKKAPPLAPFRPLPIQIVGLAARRVDDRVEVHFPVPTKNTDGTTPAAIARVNVYAMSAAAGDPIPSPTQVVTKKHRIGFVEVRPVETPETAASKPAAAAPPSAPAPAPPAPVDLRPQQGEIATFIDTPPPVAEITPAAIKPTKPATAKAATTTTTASTTATAAPTLQPSRVYAVSGVTAKGREQVAALLTVLLGPLPPAPHDVKLTSDETTLTLTWAGLDNDTYRVYAVDRTGAELPGALLTPAPIAAKTFQAPVVFGVETCFVVRAVVTIGPVVTESAAAAPDPKCQTPVDRFPPPAPTGLKAVPDVGQVNLVWDAVDAADLAGYIVLRREGGSETMQPLTPAPITVTNYEDKTTRAGVQYDYAVIAVDQAKPPNRSPESAHQSVTARSPDSRHDGPKEH